MNEENKQSSGIYLDKFIITNANDLKDTDFACYTDFLTHEVTVMQAQYDNSSQTLNISASDGKPVNMFSLRDIHFGQSSKDINLCNPEINFYRTVDGKLPDLSKAQSVFQLKSAIAGMLPNLNMTLSILKNGQLNIHWNYDDSQTMEQPFEVPESVINVNKSDLSEFGVLSDYLFFNQSETGPMQINVMSVK